MPIHPELSLTLEALLFFVRLTPGRKISLNKKVWSMDVSPELLFEYPCVWVCVWEQMHIWSQFSLSTSSEAGSCLLLHRPGWSSPWGRPSVSHPAVGALGLQMWVTTSGCLMRVLGSLLRSSHLHSEYVTHWNISPLHPRRLEHISSRLGLTSAESVTSQMELHNTM